MIQSNYRREFDWSDAADRRAWVEDVQSIATRARSVMAESTERMWRGIQRDPEADQRVRASLEPALWSSDMNVIEVTVRMLAGGREVTVLDVVNLAFLLTGSNIIMAESALYGLPLPTMRDVMGVESKPHKQE